MAIDDNTIYGLYGSQIKDLPEKINAVKGKARELTTADYNYPADNPTYVALWLLEPGVYWRASNSVEVRTKTATSGSTDVSNMRIFIISGDITTSHPMMAIGDSSVKTTVLSANGGSTVGFPKTYLTGDSVVDNLASTSTTTPLSANQGKVLKGLIDGVSQSGSGAPTTSTTGTVGQLYQDTTNGKLYICADTTGGTYTWVEVGAGGGSGPTVVQTTGTSTTDVMSQNAVTSMVFADPAANQKVQIGVGSNAGGGTSVSIGVTSNASGNRGIAFGETASASASYSIALGAGAKANQQGQIDVSTTRNGNTYGYNSTQYRLLTGLYDPQSAHDAATKGYVDTAVAGAGVSAFTTNEWNALWA